MTDAFVVSYVGLWLLVITAGILIVGLLARLVEIRGLLERVDLRGIDSLIGTSAAHFSAVDARTSRPLSLSTFRGERGILLFLSAACGSCKQLAARLDLPAAYRSRLIVVFQDHTLVSTLPGSTQCLVDADGQLVRSYQVERFPVAVIIDGRSTIVAARHAQSIELIMEWLDTQDHNIATAGARTNHVPQVTAF